MRKSWPIALAAVAAVGLQLTVTTDARPDDITPFLGTFETKGRYSNWRHTKASFEITKTDDGAVIVSRTGKYTSRRHRRKPAFTWSSREAKVEGDELKVTFRVSTSGVSVFSGEGGNLIDALSGEPASDAAGAAVDPDSINVFEATYSFDGDEFRETVVNTTRIQPDRWWRRVGTKGKQLSSPDPDVEVKRVKLGGEVDVAAGRYTVVVPTDGELVLEVTSGAVTLEDPSGNVAGVVSGSKVTLEVPHENPVLGTYTAVVTDAGEDSKLRATFVQRGKIDARIRPWSSHTYYPIFEFSWGESENEDTLFKKDGALEKFDKALELSGRASALWWEKGTDYRTGFGFEHGHYTKVRSPTEKKAEAEWKADLDGDGMIETEEPQKVLERYDTDADGKVSAAEAKTVFEAGVIKKLFASYDDDGNEKISAGEISSSFVSTHDGDASGDIDYAEWDKALRNSFAQVVESRAADAIKKFMAKDGDDDGMVALEELGTPGSVDFQDSGDVDGDKDSFFDRDNIKIVTKADETHYGNKVVEEDGKLKLFKGRKKDELVVELSADDVKEREDGIADGDLDDSYSVGWWGHCNAWSMASIIFRKPTAEVEVNGVKLSVRDQKGLLVEFGMGDTEDSTFWWQQWGEDEIPPAKYTAAFHQQMHRWLRVEQQGMMADMDLKDPHNQLNFQVWNYPLIGYEATLTEAEGDDPYVLDVSNTIEKGSYADEDSSGTASVSYRLQFNESGTILDGDESKTDWTQKSGETREYIRYLMHPFRFTKSGSRNPNVTLERLEKLLGDALKYNDLDDLEAEEAASGGLPTPSSD